MLGRPYLQATLLLVKTTTKSKGKTYDRYMINVPRWLGEKLNPRGERKVPVLAYLTRPWIHQLLPLDPEDPIYRSLPEEVRGSRALLPGPRPREEAPGQGSLHSRRGRLCQSTRPRPRETTDIEGCGGGSQGGAGREGVNGPR